MPAVVLNLDTFMFSRESVAMAPWRQSGPHFLPWHLRHVFRTSSAGG